MNLDEFVSKGWQDHAGDAEGVFARFPAGVALVSEAKHLPPLASLVVHVAGEHLGKWAEGLSILDRMGRLPVCDVATPEGKAVERSKAILHLCAGDVAASRAAEDRARAGGKDPAPSDRIRVLAVAASALAGRDRVDEARAMLSEALALAAYGPAKSDPAARALAVTGNNLACALEEKASRTPAETGLMLQAATAGLEYWSIAGGWTETERAHYRLAMSHLKAGNPVSALTHAERCLSIVDANGADPDERKYALEAVQAAKAAVSRAPAATS
jgi:hypothetical protein